MSWLHPWSVSWLLNYSCICWKSLILFPTLRCCEVSFIFSRILLKPYILSMHVTPYICMECTRSHILEKESMTGLKEKLMTVIHQCSAKHSKLYLTYTSWRSNKTWNHTLLRIRKKLITLKIVYDAKVSTGRAENGLFYKIAKVTLNKYVFWISALF